MLVSPRLLYKHCYGRYAIPAVNVFTMEQVLALFAAAQEAAAPILVQLTPAARNYASPLMLQAMLQGAAKLYPEVLYAIHLDHGNEAHALAAIEQGYTSVMIDASHDPFDINCERTRSVVEKAHPHGIVVEAELGVLSGVEDDLSVEEKDALYTNPEQAALFVARTGCDSLAIAVGTSHGAYKFSGGKGIQFSILEKIQAALPGFPLVLHGSSCVDPAVVAAINAHGGKLKPDASGVRDEELQKAIRLGICKVNIATDLRLLWTRDHRQFFSNQPDLIDPVVPGKIYMQSYREFMLNRFAVMGAAGQSKELQPLVTDLQQVIIGAE
ncbi:class II fructose-bisphosphate aldolase [Flavihumibacter sp. CACIAM 22H1]|uniref:class II fructose-bisphosphate aldolase n=1 Tax=Flavihumibacter sp. CACIAM 22H1 TaxID=1812911 RepID=UPI0007A8FD5C|nr:class II fructose-bisphosphate aldolase [Flavihumibacter sp. CACIAM 22H1]KYP15478.1 MAG: fructose-bisphosphate aldolase [Flavihumibacter sp. CACIAM 22H1]